MAASPAIINQLKQIKADSEKKEKTVSDVGTSYWAFDETEMVIPLIKGALFFWIFEILFGIQEITMKKVLTLFNENKPENKKKLTANAVTTYKGDFEKFMVNTNMSPAEVWEWIQNCLQTGNIAFEKEKQILKRVFTLAPGTVEYDRIQQGARNYELKKAQLKAKRKSKTVDETINKAGSLDKFNNCALLLKYAFDHQIDFNKTKMIFELLYDMVEPVSTMVDRKYKYEREITTNDDFVALCNEIEPNLARMEPFNAARIRVEQPIGNNNNNNISPQSIEGSLSSNNNNNNNLDHNINHNEMEMPPSRQPTNKNNNLNDNDSRFTPQGFQLKPITNEHNGQVEGYAIEPKQQNKGKKRKERDEGDTSDSPNKKRKLSPLEQLKQDEKNGVYGTPSGTSAAGKDKTAGGQTGIISQNGETPAGPDIRIDDKSKSHREITRKELETLMTQLINDPKNKKLRNTSKSDEIMKKDMKSLNDLHQNIQFILNKGWQFTTHNLMDANDIIRRLTK